MSFEEIAGSSSCKADTYGFSESERDLILSQTETLSYKVAFKQGQKDDLFAKLENLRRREVTLSLHSSTLAEYVKCKRIPRGLRSNLAPNLLNEDQEFMQKWYGISNQYSFDLMLLTIQHIQNSISTVKTEITQVESQLRENYPQAQVESTLQSINESIFKLKDAILKVKLKKFERDTKDFENNRVYSWNKLKRKADQPSTYGQHLASQATGGTSSDSDQNSDETPRKRSFLSLKRTIHNPPPGPLNTAQGGGGTRNDRPQTRAWTTRGRGRYQGRR